MKQVTMNLYQQGDLVEITKGSAGDYAKGEHAIVNEDQSIPTDALNCTMKPRRDGQQRSSWHVQPDDVKPITDAKKKAAILASLPKMLRVKTLDRALTFTPGKGLRAGCQQISLTDTKLIFDFLKENLAKPATKAKAK